jgi:hypothetical protein
MNDKHEPEQDALLQIEGPKTAAWGSAALAAGTCGVQNLQPAEKVTEVLSEWLGSIDYGENS